MSVSRRYTTTASHSQKISLRTSILDKNLERERLHLLEDAKNGRTSSEGNINQKSQNEVNGGYGSMQPCEQNDYDNGYANASSSDECNNLLRPPKYMRSFSSGGRGLTDYDRANDEGIGLGSREATYPNFANCNSRNLSEASGSHDCAETVSCSVLQYSHRPPPRRYEVPPIYFVGRGGSVRGSVSSATPQQSRRNVKFQAECERYGYSRIATSPGDLACRDSPVDSSQEHLHYYMDGNHPNMGNHRNASYTNGSTLDEGSPTIQFEDADDLFVNFNATMGRLPELQRELGCRLRRHLQFFFMNPLQKYQIRRQFPFKLFLQILKVVFITIQLILFAELRISHVDFLDDSVTVMRHRFLKNWDNDRDEVVYPPDSGKYSVFTTDEILEHFGFIVKSYYTIQNDSFASFSYDTTFTHRFQRDNPTAAEASTIMTSDFARIPPIRFCRDRIADVSIQNDTYIFDISQVKECFSLNFTRAEVDAVIADLRNIGSALARRNISFNAEDALSMTKATLSFNMRTIHFSPLSTDQKPECYLIKITIDFDNSRHTGQVFVRLNSIISYVNLCNGRVLQVFTLGLDVVAIGIIDILVLLMCLFSLLLCSRALIKAQLLKKTTCEYFSKVFNRHLSITDQLEFFNLWYVMILINDVLIVMGTICKVTIEFRDFDSDLFTLTGILLGLGALLVYIGLLRYLGFFSQYNILVLTLKRSLPSILRFMVCTIILYAGFLIAGWVIIGPYSIKFRTLSQSSEALFSLLNGDDMFATFYTISDSSTTIKVVGTIYIYFFVCLFIYIVLSLFIAIIMDSYEVVKERYDQSVKVERSTLYEFLASAEPPDEGSAEARELFAAERLLRLDDSWLLQNWSEIRRSLRQIYRNVRRNSGPGTSNTDSTTRAAAAGYHAFENPAHDSSGESATDGEQDGVATERRRRMGGVSLGNDVDVGHTRRRSSLSGDESLMTTLANGGSIAIGAEQHSDLAAPSGIVVNNPPEGSNRASAAHYQVSPSGSDASRRRNSPLQPNRGISDAESGIVRLDGFESSQSTLH